MKKGVRQKLRKRKELPSGSPSPHYFTSPLSVFLTCLNTFSNLLSRAEGVGDCSAALTENGAVIVCEGAEDPLVRLSLLQAVRSYTGFASDRITILKMAGKG